MTEPDSLYTERNTVLALLAKLALERGWKAGVGFDDDVGFGWSTVLFIDLPTGQVSWHFPDREAHLLKDLPLYREGWDGHSTEEKYARVRAMLGQP